MRRGRPPAVGTPAERAAARREKVRLNVQAHRMRRKNGSGSDCPILSEKKPIVWVENWQPPSKPNSSPANANLDDEENAETGRNEVVSGEPKHYSDLSTSLVVAPDTSKQYTFALLGVLRTRLLPESISLPTPEDVKPRLATPCAAWILNACEIVADQHVGALKDTLLAVSLAILSSDRGRSHLQPTSLEFYRRALCNIRKGLQPIISGDCSLKLIKDVRSLFLSCHAAAMFELFINGSLYQTLQHVRGIRMLIEHVSYKLGYKLDIGNNLLEDYRMLEIPFCLVHRCTSVRNRRIEGGGRRWTFDDSKRLPLKDFDYNMNGLLDIADQIPPMMVYFDRLKQCGGGNCFSGPQQQHKITFLLEVILNIEKWLRNLHTREHPFIIEDVVVNSSPGSYDGLIRFTNFEIGVSWMYGSFSKLCALETCIGALVENENRLAVSGTLPARSKPEHPCLPHLREKLRHTAHLLARSLPFFLEADKGSTGRSIAIFPLEATYGAIEKEMVLLRKDEAQVKAGENADSIIQADIRRQLEEMAKDFELCNAITVKAKEFGLPVFAER